MERFGPDSDAHGEDVNMLEAFINETAQTADEGTDMDVDSEGRGSHRRVLSAYAARSAGSADGTH
jgi:hypothetical protein